MTVSTRLLSLDVFRGITIVMMILVNSPGNRTAYAWLNHSAWNGCKFADFIFPFFLFIVGVSLVFSLSQSMERKVSPSQLTVKIFKRAIIIFFIGLFLNAFPRHFDFDTVRVFGVLQRIAICYLVAALLFVTVRIQTQILIAVTLLLGYWMVMTMTFVPGYGVGDLTHDGNLAAYIDRLVFAPAHLYEKTFDPEGFLSTFPAIATTLLGNITGFYLRNSLHTEQKKMFSLALAGICLAALGWLWGLSFPINKGLWTSSFVLWTGGFALVLLTVLYGLIEIKHWQAGFKPFEIFGLNAIAAYFLHIFFLKIQAIIQFTTVDGSSVSSRIYLTDHLFGSFSPHNASLLYAISYVLVWLGGLTLLYRKKIFIKI